MEIATSIVTASDIRSKTEELCRIDLPGAYQPEHLPAELKREQESYQSQMLYHLSAAAQLYQNKGLVLNESLLRWYETAYYYEPKDLLQDPNWENFYPALVVEDKPYRDLGEAVEAPEAEQRYLATQLLSGTLTKKKQDRLLTLAQRLVCTLDPRDKNFFGEATLAECLEREGLDSNKEINKVLGQKHYAPVTKADKREALALCWERRNSKLKIEWQFETGSWDEWEYEAVRDFTYYALSEIAQLANSAIESEFRAAIWAVLKEASERDELEDHFLDPREEDTWIGLRRIALALSKVDVEEMYADSQNGIFTAQRWMKEVGLPNLYCGKDDWWAELPDMERHQYEEERNYNLLLGKSNLTPREEVLLYRGMFIEEMEESPVKQLVVRKYWKPIKEALGNA
jgi:hypothetical protein